MWAYFTRMQTQISSLNSTCHISGHILNMHVQYGALTWQRENPFGGSAICLACKVCCKNWNMDCESILVHLNIPSLQQRKLQLKANMMYQFVHGVSYIYSFIPPPTMTHVIVLISLFPMLEQMLINIPSSHTLCFWNSLPPTVAQAQSSSVIKKFIEFYV